MTAVCAYALSLLVAGLVSHEFGETLDGREWVAAAAFGPKGIAIVTAASIVAHSSTDVLVARGFPRTAAADRLRAGDTETVS